MFHSIPMKHHSVYVIKLDKKVLRRKKFREANPNYNPLKPCVYVGMTGLDPEQRFQNHMSGHKASKWAQSFGERLLPKLYEHLNPMTSAEAEEKEIELRRKLRNQGFGVWPADSSEFEES